MSGAAIGEYPLCIDTPDGPFTVMAAHETVICDDEVQRASVTLRLGGAAYAGHGSDTEYALYDLCDGWQVQSEETYTYTSYLEHTKRGHTNETDPDLAEA